MTPHPTWRTGGWPRAGHVARALTIVLLLGGILTGWRSASAMAESAASGISGNTYTGVNYDWSVEWDTDVWDEYRDDNSDGRDYLYLAAGIHPVAFVSIWGIADYGGDPEACAKGWGDDYLKGYFNIDGVTVARDIEAPSAPRGQAGQVYTYPVGTGQMIEYVQCRTLVEGEAVLIQDMTTLDTDYADALPLFSDLIDTVNVPGDTQASGSATDERTDSQGDGSTDSGLADEPYTGASFPWSVTWDADVWEVGNENNEDGSDYLRLDTIEDDPAASVGFSASDVGGNDTRLCVDLHEVNMFTDPSASDITEAELDDTPSLPRGSRDGAYAYDYVFEDGSVHSLIDYVACLPLGEGGAILEIDLTAEADRIDDALGLLADLTDTLQVGADAGQPVSDTEPSDDPGTSDGGDQDPAAASGVEGERFSGINVDWSVDWDGSDWSVGAEDNSGGTDYFRLDLSGDYALIEFEAGALPGDDPHGCIEAYTTSLTQTLGDTISNLTQSDDLDVLRAPRDGANAVYSYTVTEEGESVDLVAYVECRPLDGDDSVLVVYTALDHNYADYLPLVKEVLDTIEAGNSGQSDDPLDDPILDQRSGLRGSFTGDAVAA